MSDPRPPMPPDPVTSLAEGAARLHELFTARMNAGFTRCEALHLAAGIITASVSHGTRPPPEAGNG